ncbi:MAG TPA: 2-phosphosulfolactate phosphatase [Verrucomicrobiae bacterium]|jgi:2-phosphosulfolactate phosphatase
MSDKRIEVLFSPTEYSNLRARDLSQTTCVVFDILRATTTTLTALANGAAEIIPVSEIPEALALRAKDSNILLAGERDGFRIKAAQTGGIDFDFGNSPREFTPDKIRNRRIAITTTNGTRALRACAHSTEIHIGSFLNLSTLAKRLSVSPHPNLLIICAGTADESSLEDTLAAGALCEALPNSQLRDSAEIALATYLHHKPNLIAAVSAARNGRRLLSIPELAPDVAICFQHDTLEATARLHPDGAIRAE